MANKITTIVQVKYDFGDVDYWRPNELEKMAAAIRDIVSSALDQGYPNEVVISTIKVSEETAETLVESSKIGGHQYDVNQCPNCCRHVMGHEYDPIMRVCRECIATNT